MKKIDKQIVQTADLKICGSLNQLLNFTAIHSVFRFPCLP